ncbi:hypothetical protein [Spirilliplanes yamanashiensis]|uniref:DUF2637 domain-containing protein n=1 Tax=Spirilliplanes yamanashiensis TaxID=42233 RepID=A0A8J3Y4G8_9ACTN|nr:hypothetical protein [Spirilliplanes yamanashiensis]MDP9819958.1 hypothetical protein [Spirilliplanes yamanashiensis]GIJ01223.1 hypothetical protein Sya03_05750 [Spirilliplanes yamanashiensis]
MTTTSRTERLESRVLVAILILVGLAAGAASFTHVHDWTMDNTPVGTPGWFGWANAVISELVPIAALLTIRRRKRHGGPIGYPMTLLIAAAGLSLAAQLAVAKPGPSGWLLSAVPALAFMALVKLVLAPVSTTPAEPVGPAAEPVAQLVDEPDTIPTPAPAQPVVVLPVEPPAHLLTVARFAVNNHEQTTGRPITAAELAARMSVTPAVAGQLITAITGQPTHPVNGTPVVLTGGAR